MMKQDFLQVALGCLRIMIEVSQSRSQIVTKFLYEVSCRDNLQPLLFQQAICFDQNQKRETEPPRYPNVIEPPCMLCYSKKWTCWMIVLGGMKTLITHIQQYTTAWNNNVCWPTLLDHQYCSRICPDARLTVLMASLPSWRAVLLE